MTDFASLFDFTLTPELQARLLWTAVVLLLTWLLRVALYRLVDRRYAADPRALYNWRKAVQYSTFVLGLVLLGQIWLQSLGSMATYLGLLSAGLAVALRDLVVNAAGWLFINWRRPFVVRDRIQIGHHAGDVIDIRFFEFSLLEIGNWVSADQSTGRVIHIPNGRIFTEMLANYTQGLPYIWHEIPVLVTFESDWEKAKQILTDILVEHAPASEQAPLEQSRSGPRFVLSYANLAPTVYTRVDSNGVLLTLRYMVDPRQRRDSEQAMWEAILHAFARHVDIDFAYETRRQYQNWHEGKAAKAAEETPTGTGAGTEE